MSFFELKIKTWQNCILFGDSKEEFVSWPFSSSRGCPHAFTHGPSQHLHQYNLFPPQFSFSSPFTYKDPCVCMGPN